MNSTEITLNKALELQAESEPDKIFIIHQDNKYSYSEISVLVNRLASTLQNNGIKKGDSVCLLLPRTPELIITFLASTRIGALPAPVNYLLCTDDVIQFVNDINPKALITSTCLLPPELNSVLSKKNNLLRIDINRKKDSKEWVAWESVVASPPYTEKDRTHPEDVAYLNFTTGTSGNPKGALATHANIYWNTRSSVEMLKMDEKDTHLCMFASFSHPHELFARALYTGASLVLLEKINPKTIIQTINLYSVTCMMGLAPMYEMMANRCGHMSVPSLRIAESGGMFTRNEVNDHFFKQFNIPILSVWGSTETTGIALANNLTDYRTDGSMGKACPYCQIKLIDENNQEAASGEVGELYFKGPGVIAGYKNHPPLLDKDNWYASGDIARKDEDGYYYFVERKSGMIKIAGLKVYPLQVELLLIQHPRISEVAVIGIKDQRKGYIPKAYVVIEDKNEFNGDDILSFCKGKIPSYMIPKNIEIMDSLPKVGSGKINKKALI